MTTVNLGPDTKPAECPDWCADRSHGEPHHYHRSKVVWLHHGHYGDARAAVSLFASSHRLGVGVSLDLWAEDLADEEKPDHRFIFAVDEAAALAGLLEDAVRQATVPLSVLEAASRLDRAKKILAEVMDAERIGHPATLPWSSTEHQKRAVVPLDVVMRLSAALAPGAYPVEDPWSEDEDEVVVPRLGDIYDGPGPVEEAVRNIVVLCRGATRVEQVDRGAAEKVLADMAACSSIEWAARLDERERAAVLRRFPEPEASS